MKKLSYLLFGITLAFGMVSCGKDDPDPRNGGGHSGGGGRQQNDAYTFTANDIWAGYYGDHLGYGTGVYLVQLTDGSVDDNGDLTVPGNSLLLAISGQLLNNTSNLALPEGTYKTGGNNSNTFKIYNGLNSNDEYNSWLEVWANGENQSEYYFIEDGTLTIKRSGMNYTITADVEVFYYDDNDNTTSAGQVVATYTGQVNVNDMTGSGESETPYEPIKDDLNLGDMDDMDCYFYSLTESLLGNYYMHIYDLAFDKNGKAVSEGNILTLDLYADYTSAPDLNQLNGTYKVAELDELVENTFQPGYVFYSESDQDWVYWGTYVDEVVKQDGNFVLGRCGVVTGGTVDVSHKGENLIIDIKLRTETGALVTGKYAGKPEVIDEGELGWGKARKAKANKKDTLRPFSKFERKPARKAKSTKIKAKAATISHAL